MTARLSWRRLTPVLFTLVALALLLYTIGAPHEHGG
jgi:hypothetical protein